MPIVESHEQVLARYESVMGKELALAHKTLNDDVVWLRFKWQQYRNLFGTSSERIEYLRESASSFFGMVDSVLFEDTLLHISRLTDPVGTGQRRNLTLLSIPPLIADEQLRRDVEALVDAAVNAARFARDWRNRHIAHRDLRLALDDSAPALEIASRGLVEGALAAIEKAVASLDSHFFNCDTDFGLHGEPGDALDLLHVLRDGLRAARQRDARFEAGTPTDEDLRPAPLR